jgi:iron complex transport system permease protein
MAGTTRLPRLAGTTTIRTGHFSQRFDLRVIGLIVLSIVLLVGLMLWSMTLGAVELSLRQVYDGTFGRGDDRTLLVVQTLRWPRTASAVVIGAALAISGALFQGIARNPLVSPDIIGINSGATMVAVGWLVLLNTTTGLPLATFIGAVVTATLIYGLSWRGGVSPNRLILVGIGVSAMTAAVSSYLMVMFPIERTRPAIVWTMGSIYASSWTEVRLAALCLAIVLPIAVVLMHPMRSMMLGDLVTRSLIILLGCALAAVAVAIAGPIGFIALMVPHMARMIAGPASGSVLVFTGLLGGIVLLLSDVLSQHFLPVTLPVGIVTSAVGAPYFLFLLYRSNRQA